MTNRLQNQYTPDRASPPGETLAELLEDRGMNQAELADRMGRPKKTISEIIGAKAELTPETALQLERVLGVPASFWSNLERHYRDSLARADERAQLAAHADWPQRFPLGQMVKYGWIRQESDPAERVRLLLSFFGVSSIEQWKARYEQEVAAYRRPVKFEPDPHDLSAWLRQGERRAAALECAPFEASALRAALAQVRALTRVVEPDVFIGELQKLCCACGVAVVFVRELPRSRASGVARWLTPQKALIQLSLRYRSNDHLWFTFFHEAGHLLLHGKREVFLESLGAKRETEELEAEANQFAADQLIPRSAYGRLRRQRPFSAQRIAAFADEVGVAPGIVVGQLQHDGELPYTHLNGLKIRYEWAAEPSQ